jgi:cell division protein FtsQ
MPTSTRFADRAHAHRRRPWRRAVAALVTAACAASLAWTVGWSPVLGVDQVAVVGVSGVAQRRVVSLAEVSRGTPLIRIDPAAVAARVRTDVTIAEVSVHRSWPRTLTIDVVRRTPAIVVRDPAGRLEVVDSEGVAFGAVSVVPPGVPLVSASGDRGMTEGALRASLALLDALPADLGRQVAAVTVTSADLVTFRLGSRTVIWGGGNDAARKVSLLRALLPMRARVIDVSAPGTPVVR